MNNELNKRMGYFLQSSKKNVTSLKNNLPTKYKVRLNGSFSLLNLFTSHKERTKSINNVKKI